MDNIFRPQQRMYILRSLYLDASRRMNTEMLKRFLKHFGHSLPISEVNWLVSGLENQGYLTVERLGEGVVIAQLTRAGEEVADGSTHAEGVDRPPLET